MPERHPRERDLRRWRWIEACLWHSFCFAVLLLLMEYLLNEMAFRTVIITAFCYGTAVLLGRLAKSFKEDPK